VWFHWRPPVLGWRLLEPAQIEIVPSGIDGGEDAGRGVEAGVPSHAEAVAVQRAGCHTLAAVPTLLDDGVARPCEQVCQEHRLLPNVDQKSAHKDLSIYLSFFLKLSLLPVSPSLQRGSRVGLEVNLLFDKCVQGIREIIREIVSSIFFACFYWWACFQWAMQRPSRPYCARPDSIRNVLLSTA